LRADKNKRLYIREEMLALGIEAAERRASAAPLAGVGRVEDTEKRQVPGNARAADPWSAEDADLAEAAGDCALSVRQQAVAFCRVNCVQPTNRASGVSCTPWFGCFFNITGQTLPICFHV